MVVTFLPPVRLTGVFCGKRIILMTVSEYNTSVDKFSDGIYRFILKNIADEEHSKDIVQESYLRLWEKRQNVTFDKVKTYLFTTAYHLMVDLIRRSKYRASYENHYDDKVSTSGGFSDLGEILEKAVNQLPEIQKSAILLRDYEGYSYQEIGKITGLNESQVKVYIYRARMFLKQYIGSLDRVI
jgi:RNA polymerase sigma-70 factor (ECF subfamily)